MLIALSRANIYLLNILIKIKLSILHLKKIRKRCMLVFFVCLMLVFCEGILAFYENLFKI